MYKIQFGERTLIIIKDLNAFSFDDIGKNKAVIYRYSKPKKLKEIISEIGTSPIKNHILINLDTEMVFKELLKNFTQIIAGGGLVTNEKNQILFIYRNNKWDLPKGKIELGESTEHGAVREVEEECGIKISKIGELLEITYHTYMMDNKNIIKSNYWFSMHADSSQTLYAQAEENIEKVEWISHEKVEALLENSYESIAHLVRNYLYKYNHLNNS